VSTDQEYDAQADMVEDQDPSDITGPGPYPAPFGSQQLPPPSNQPQPANQPQGGPTDAGPGFSSMNQMLDPYDPMLDMDPFGLSASMHFPTQFTFDTSSMR